MRAPDLPRIAASYGREPNGRSTVELSTAFRPAAHERDYREVGENRYAFPFFKVWIRESGTLAIRYRQRAHAYLAMLDQQLADRGPVWINSMLDSAWGTDKTKWLTQAIRLMQKVEPEHCPPALPAKLVALGLPRAAARAFFTFAAATRTPDLRHHAIALFARMDHTTRAQLLQAANLPVARAREMADAFAAQMLRDVNTPLQTAALLMVLALKPTPGDLLMLVDERFAPPLLDGMISSSLRYDEAKVFMHDPVHRKVHATVELNNLRSANPARHVELLGGYLAEHGHMPESFGKLLCNYLRDVAGDTELPDETTARTVVRGRARRLIGPESTSAVAQAMGKTSTERLGTLLAHGIAVDIPDAHGFTALHYAIAALDIEKVRLLLQHFANPLRQPVGLLHKFSDTLRKLGGTLRGLPPHKPLKFAEKLCEQLDSPVQQMRLTEIIDLLETRATHMPSGA